MQQKMKNAYSLLDGGQFAEARAQFAKFCEMDDANAEAWLMVGAIDGEMGNADAALQGIHKALEIDPGYARAHLSLGHVQQANGDHDAALESFRKAAELDPQDADTHFILANLLLSLGRSQEALTSFHAAVNADMEYGEAWVRLGWCQREAGDLIGAEGSYRKASELEPDRVEWLLELANVQNRSRLYGAALVSYEHVIDLQPDNADAWNNMGTVLQAQSESRAAMDAYRKAVELRPAYPEANKNLGSMLQIMSRSDEAVSYFETAIAQRPDFFEAHESLGEVMQELNRLVEAIEHFQKCLELQPSDHIRVRLGTILSVVPVSREHIAALRERMEKNVESLLTQTLVINVPEREIQPVHYLLSCHGVNDLGLLGKLAALYEHAAPALGFESPALTDALQPREDGRIGIGIIVPKLRLDIYGILLVGLLKSLDRERFALTVFTSVPPRGEDERMRYIQEQADNTILLPDDLATARETISQQRLPVLLFADTGRDALSYFLAFARMAPVQCVAWDYPVSSGLKNIDYFLSCDAFETSDADDRYSEQLVRLEGLPAFVGVPPFNDSVTSEQFGLEEGRNLYLCTGSPQKLHPDLDQIIAGILRRDSDGVVVLVQGLFKDWSDSIIERMRDTISDVMDRIHVVDTDTIEQGSDLLALVDVVLDTPHYCDLSVTYQAISTGTPVVTIEGESQRARQSAALLRHMGFDDLVADGPEALIDIAVALGTDKARCAMMSQKLRETAVGFYDDTCLIDSLGRFFTEVVEQARNNAESL